MNTIWIFAFAIGVVAGLRSLTAPAAVAWASHLGWLRSYGSPFGFMESTIAVVIFSILAVVELIGDKLPMTPKRTALIPLLARIGSGGFCAACFFLSTPTVLLGVVGAMVGAFGGYAIRRRLTSGAAIKNFFVALCEDAVAIGLAFWLVSR
jgi:uncharacterized membrane protein